MFFNDATKKKKKNKQKNKTKKKKKNKKKTKKKKKQSNQTDDFLQFDLSRALHFSAYASVFG